MNFLEGCLCLGQNLILSHTYKVRGTGISEQVLDKEKRAGSIRCFKAEKFSSGKEDIQHFEQHHFFKLYT